MKKITLQDIANKANVAKSTASYALNNRYEKGVNISEDTRERIKKLAMDMGYIIDDMARAISTGKTQVIGFACGAPPHSDYFTLIITSIMETASKYGFLIKLLNLTQNNTEQFINICKRQRLSALLLYCVPEQTLKQVVRQLKKDNIIPAVIGNSYTPGKCIHVCCDDHLGCKLMVEKLFKLGHRKIAFMAANLKYTASKIRLDGYIQTMKNLCLDVPDEYVFGNKKPEKIKSHVFKLLKNSNRRPDAIFCSGDNIASMVIDSIKDFGFKIPDDISVAGFGNLDCGRFSIPSISTINEFHSKTSARVVEKIVDALSNRDFGAYYETVKPSVVLRESTAEKLSTTS